MRASALSLLAALALLTACDSSQLDDFEEEVVVSAVLIAEQHLPTITLARTGPIGEIYDPGAKAIDDAEVMISLLGPDGQVEAAYPYTLREIGRYFPDDRTAEVMPGRRYRFEAAVPGFEGIVTAETVVPAAFEIVRPPPDTVFYQVGPSPTADVTPSGVGDQPAVYIFTIFAGNPDPSQLTPFAAELFGERDVDLDDLSSGSSPLLNEGNYIRNDDGTIRIEVPWFVFNFYGENSVTFTALDDALRVFLELQAVQFVPTTISPGEIPNVATNVVNGVGVFGAAAQVTATLFVARP